MKTQRDTVISTNQLPTAKQWGYGTAMLLSAVCVSAIAPSEALATPLSSLSSTFDTSNESIAVQDDWAIEPAAKDLMLTSEFVPEEIPASPENPSPLLTQLEDETFTADDETPKFGTAGKQRLYVQGAVASDFDDETLGLVGVGVSHFFYDAHSVNLELNALAFDQPGDNALGLNLNFLVRSHWIRGENWSVYIDGGAGIIGTTSDVPTEGSSFNFTPQIGAGATFQINDTQRLMTGLRYYHISNADTFESNPGLDALMGYVGLNFPL